MHRPLHLPSISPVRLPLRVVTPGLFSCALLGLVHCNARAQTEDPLTFRASYAVQTDSNLFRLPANANTQALIGKSSGAEQIGLTTLGVGFKTRQSLQQLEFDVELVHNNYQNFDYLSYTATNYNAAWRFSFTPRWVGNLTASRAETLNSFTDFQGFQRNLRIDTNTALDTAYEIYGPWRLVAGLSNTRQANDLAVTAGSDFNNTAANLGLRRLFGSGSSATYSAKLYNGSYLNRNLPSAGLLDNAYKQVDNDFRLHWQLRGGSGADANITFASRSHPNYPQRDYSGVNSGASFNWLLSDKTSLYTAYSRVLDAYATSNSNYSQTDRLSVGPVWQISAKTSLRLQSQWSQIDYLGTPTAVPASTRRDQTRDTSLSLVWQPATRLSLSASLQTLSRSSNQAGLDYDSNLVYFSAQYAL